MLTLQLVRKIFYTTDVSSLFRQCIALPGQYNLAHIEDFLNM